MSDFNIDDLRRAINDVERVHGTDRAVKIIRAGAPDYDGDLTHIPKNVYPGLILDLQEAVAGRRYFGQPRHSTFSTTDAKGGYSIPQHHQNPDDGSGASVDTNSIWEKFNAKKKPAPQAVAHADASEERKPAAVIDTAKIYARWNSEKRADPALLATAKS